MMEAFQGFTPSNTTPVPDIIFDELLTELSGPELKVLLYIIRRTAGFKKETDPISLTQFTHGIMTKDGRVLDKGCGIKDRSRLVKTLISLEEKGCIKSQKRKNKNGSETTVYSLRFRGSVENDTRGSVENDTRGSVENDTHKRQNTRNSITRNRIQERKTGSDAKETAPRQEKSDSPSVTLSLEEKAFYDLFCQIETAPTISEICKKHCAMLAPRVKTLDQVRSLHTFTKKRIAGPNKQVFLGNMVKNLAPWEAQQQGPAQTSPQAVIPTKKPISAEEQAKRNAILERFGKKPKTEGEPA